MSTRMPTSGLETDDALLDFIFQNPNSGNTLYAPTKTEEDDKAASTSPETILLMTSDYVSATTTEQRDEIIATRLSMTNDEMKNSTARVGMLVRLANSGPTGLETSESEFTDLLQKHPYFVPALNSRSQITQIRAALLAKSLAEKTRGGVETTELEALQTEANRLLKSSITDLHTAIAIFEKQFPEYQLFKTKPLEGVKGENNMNIVQPPKFFIQSLTQRGMGYDHTGNREKAVSDLTFAANLGGAYARQQLVAMNPLAQLNNETVAEMMAQITNPQPSSK